jgi:NTE family protein
MPRTIVPLQIALVLLLSACSSLHYPVNPPLDTYSAERIERARTLRPRGSSDHVFVVVTFSGGGTRAAAFGYGILEELATTNIVFDGRERNLLNEIDVVSGVSGGSFIASYFGLHGPETLQSFAPRFLYRDVQKALKRAVFAPRNWGSLWSSKFARSDLIADWFDREVFDRATFSDLARKRGASVIINATDLTRGAPFSFIADQFALICSDLGKVHLARAAVASAAVPVLFSPITLRNYAGRCGYQVPDWVSTELANGQHDPRRGQRAELIASYLESVERPYIHLVDGGLSDNLGLRAILDEVVFAGGIQQTIERQRLGATDHILFVVVNAQSGLNSSWDKLEGGPSATQVVDAATTVQINRYNFETVELLRRSVAAWGDELRNARCQAAREANNAAICSNVNMHLVEINFESVKDPEKRKTLRLMPTSFALPKDAVDQIRSTARELLHDSAEYHEFLQSVTEKP